MELGLAGKTVIVTGGASNIGRSISLAFSREGCNVAIVDLDAPQAEKVVGEMAAWGAKGAFIKTDVTEGNKAKASPHGGGDDSGRYCHAGGIGCFVATEKVHRTGFWRDGRGGIRLGAKGK